LLLHSTPLTDRNGRLTMTSIGKRNAVKDIVPRRGDNVARWWLVGGIVSYAIFIFLLYVGALNASDGGAQEALLSLIGLGDHQNLTMLALVVIGVVVFVLALASAFRDWRRLGMEEADVEWVLSHPNAAGLVFAPARERATMYDAGKRDLEHAEMQVETLMDDRVRRLITMQLDQSARVSPDDLRRLAEVRLAALGTGGRFASGLLLLLAVLGTFAGVKASLPRLIDAVSATSSTLGNAAIAAPLESVAAAFGANSLALIGAISLGIIAHGIVAGRRNLLDRMELASEPLYHGLHHGDNRDPLRDAVNALLDTGRSMKETGASLEHLDVGVANLAGIFTEAFEKLSQDLGQLSVQQQRLLTEQTATELQRLQERVAQMGEVVDANTRLYQGLVESVTTRSRESQELVTSSITAIRRLDEGLRAVSSLEARVEVASAALDERAARLDSETEHFAQRVERVGETVMAVGPAIRESQASLDRTTQALQSSLERTMQAIQEQDGKRQEGLQRITQSIVEGLSKSMERTTAAFAADVRSVVQRTAAGQVRHVTTREPTPHSESFVNGMAQGAGILVLAGIGAFVAFIISSLWNRA
jgi:hypothetical protein